MGDRGHVQLVLDGDDEKSIWVYAHWHGTELPDLAGLALAASKPRWGDVDYAARIVLTHLIGKVEGDTGWGVNIQPADTGDGGRVVRIDFKHDTVTLLSNRGETGPLSFQAYVDAGTHNWPGADRNGEYDDEDEDY